MDAVITPLPNAARAQIQSSSKINSLNEVVVSLLQNALDAGATKVAIEVDYHRRGCTVDDNGLGILPADFREDGGLGKLYHTSRHGSASAVYGRHGLFLSLLGSLSLLTITSRHHRHRSHSSLTVHRSETIARLTPALPHQQNSFQTHGTRVSVRDLFGNMPVRVKHIAIANEQTGRFLKDWRALKKDVVSLLLAWGRGLEVVIRDAGQDKKVIVRWPKAASAIPPQPGDLQRVPVTSAAVIQSLLAQGLGLSPRLGHTWIPVSASSSSLRLHGAISLEPAPTRQFQFIALGIASITADGGKNILFEQVNALFSASSFGTLDDSAMTEGTDFARPSSLHLNGKDSAGTSSSGRAKGIDRWPMFFLRIDAHAEKRTLDVGEGELTPDGALSTAVVDLLRVTVAQFLKEYGFATGRPKIGAKARKVESGRRSPSQLQRPHGSGKHGPAQSFAFRDSLDQAASTGQLAAPEERLRTALQPGRRNLKRPSRPTLHENELGGGVKLPRFSSDQSPQVGDVSRMWSRMRTSKPDAPATSNKKELKPLPLALSKAKSLPPLIRTPIGPSQAEMQSLSSSISEGLSLGKRNPRTQSAASLATTDTECDADRRSDENGVDPDEGILGVHPNTLIPFHCNNRTGNVVAKRPRLLRPPSGRSCVSARARDCNAHVTSSRQPCRQGADSKPGSWLQGILSNWTNPVFCPPQRRISRLSTCRAPDVGQSANTDCQPAFPEKRRREADEVSQIQTHKLSRAALEHAEAIAQFDGKFILVKVAASPTSAGSTSLDNDQSEILVIVDQHAADERCRIEDLLAELCTPAAAAAADVETDDSCHSLRKLHSRIKTTTLERPIDFTVTEREAQLYRASAPYFARWGLLYDVDEPEPSPPPPADAGRQPAAAEMRVIRVKTIPPGIAERCKAEPHLLLELLRGEIWRREDEEEGGVC